MLKNDKYILIGREVVEEPSLTDWGRWMQEADRRVAKTKLEDDTVISTVFLGLDHSFGEGPPLLFETMVFLSDSDGGEDYMRRYETYEQAEAGHEKAVKIYVDKISEDESS